MSIRYKLLCRGIAMLLIKSINRVSMFTVIPSNFIIGRDLFTDFLTSKNWDLVYQKPGRRSMALVTAWKSCQWTLTATRRSLHHTSMVKCSTAVFPVRKHWGYHNLALSHRYELNCIVFAKFEEIMTYQRWVSPWIGILKWKNKT